MIFFIKLILTSSYFYTSTSVDQICGYVYLCIIQIINYQALLIFELFEIYERVPSSVRNLIS